MKEIKIKNVKSIIKLIKKGYKVKINLKGSPNYGVYDSIDKKNKQFNQVLAELNGSKPLSFDKCKEMFESGNYEFSVIE